MRAALRVLIPISLVAAAVALLYAVRPGVVENAVRSPRAWAVTAGVFVIGRLMQALLRRATGRARLAAATAWLVVAALAAALLAPSFRQRSAQEPFPITAAVALAPPAPTAGPPSLTPVPTTSEPTTSETTTSAPATAETTTADATTAERPPW